MNIKEKLELLESAYKTQKRGDDDIHVFNEANPLYESLKKAQFALNEETGLFELDYDIMAKACSLMSENAEQITDKTDFIEWEELASDSASVYTGVRLSYLATANQGEISDIIHEYGKETDIATACAIWYERMVAMACELIQEHVLSEN